MSTNPLMSCESWAEQISLLAAGCLSSDEEQAVRQHIASCGPCQKEFDQMTELCGNLKDVPLVSLQRAEAVVAKAMIEITHSHEAIPDPVTARSRQGKPREVRSELFAVVCIAAVLLITVGWTMSFRGQQRSEMAVRPRLQPNRKEVLVQPVNVVAARNDTRPPTMLELRNAFAQSDDQFDMLLAQKSGTAFPTLTNIRSFDESL